MAMLTNAMRWMLGMGLVAGLTGCDEPAEGRGGDDPSSDAGGKADGVSGLPTKPGALRWDEMGALRGAPEGVPLFVSNNPEHIDGFGILAGVPYPGLSLSGAQRKAGAPEAQWVSGVADERCPDGGMQEFGAYLAHILPSSLGSGRRLTFVVVPEQDTTVTVRGEMGTTDWSRNGVSLTTSPSWLGATVAESFFFGAAPSRTLEAKAGEMLVLDTEQARSLVEGRFHVSADSCLYPFTIAHSAGLGGKLPGHYAKGDVKWPGWYNGQGYGRAAGVYMADRWRGEQAVAIEQVPSVQGVGMLTASDSMDAISRHGDSASLLFGNYGVLYDQTLELDNVADECVDVTVELVSYMDRKSTPSRTPTVQFFRDTDGAYTPSMFWNGPVQTVTAAGQRLSQAIMNYAPTAAERSDPTRALGSMRHELASLRIDAGMSDSVTVRFPVPGYIVAPMALTVHSEACGG